MINHLKEHKKVIILVMANYNDIIANSGFETMPDAKYYNKYTSDNVSTACDGKECISHGLSETSGWYTDYHTMVNETYPWLLRGGGCINSANAGVFYFNYNDYGGVRNNGSFRLVMSPSP